MTVLLASSLAAVTILVCSTRLKPTSIARLRTACRALTTSSPLRTGNVSRSLAIGRLIRSRQQLAHQNQARIEVQCSADARQRQAELDQRDRDRRTHADDHGLRIEDAGHRGYVAEH